MPQTTREKPKPAVLRRAPKQDRGKESRSKILTGAKNILSNDGYEKFSMRRISAASSVGLSTIYDYFPSKSSVLHVLLEERLNLRLEIFDRTFADIPAAAKLTAFIENYLERMRDEGFWSLYDVGLYSAARSETGLQNLFDWYEAETVDRYVRAFQSTGSQWDISDLRTAASYLISISAQFEPGAITQENRKNRKLTLQLIHQTFAMVLKEVSP